MQSIVREVFLKNLEKNLDDKKIEIIIKPQMNFKGYIRVFNPDEFNGRDFTSFINDYPHLMPITLYLDYSNYYYKTPTLVLKISELERDQKNKELFYEKIDKLIKYVEDYCNDAGVIFNPVKENKIKYESKQDNQISYIEIKIPIEFQA